LQIEAMEGKEGEGWLWRGLSHLWFVWLIFE
jgi:hypothetical protein